MPAGFFIKVVVDNLPDIYALFNLPSQGSNSSFLSNGWCSNPMEGVLHNETPFQQYLKDIRLRLRGGKQGKRALASPATMEGDAHHIHSPQQAIQGEDDDEIILREKA